MGLHFATLGDLFLHVFRTWWDLGAQFVDLWAPFGHLWNPFWCVFVALWPDPGPLFRVFWKRLEKESKKKRKRELKCIMDVCFNEFSGFSRKCESAFRLRRRERIEVQAPDFLAPCLHFCSSILALFF